MWLDDLAVIPCQTRSVIAIGRSERSVMREATEFARDGLVTVHRYLIPAITSTAPLFVYTPGREGPDSSALAYFAAWRATQDIVEDILFCPTETLRKRIGGAYSGPVHRADVQHAARLAAVVTLELTSDERALFTPEPRLGTRWTDAANVPDGLVGDVIHEVLGHSYGKDKLARRHAAWTRFTYYLY